MNNQLFINMKLKNNLTALAVMVIMVSCGSEKKDVAEDTAVVEEEAVEVVVAQPMAMVDISSASGSTMTGAATFTQNEDGTVTLELSVSGATSGSHALHLHANGDCSAPDATSAGGHWNPAEVDHGKRGESEMFHAGDIDNLEVGDDGTGELSMIVEGWSVGGPDSSNVIGKAVIIHAAADDFVSQPSGAAGPREGCGVVVEKN